MTSALMALVAAVMPRADAFCGVYVGGADDALVNRESRVILSHLGGQSTLTLSADVETDLSEFALVIPVPPDLGEDDVRTMEAELVDFVFDYSGPRAVEYTCEDTRTQGRLTSTAPEPEFGCTEYELAQADRGSEGGVFSGEIGDADASTVAVEAEFSEAEYDIVILSSEEGDDLDVWLNQHGFALPGDAETVLQAYIDEGSHFLAAKVDLAEVPEGRTWLSPLQLVYADGDLVLPIRIGTLAADGPQEVIAVTFSQWGGMGIANYPEATLEDECMWSDDTDFPEHFASSVDAAIEEVGGAGWIREYSWPLSQKCDPCTVPSGFTEEQLTALGVDPFSLTWLTRMRLRYTPELATQDVVFYENGLEEIDQLRYITPLHELEYLFPVCGEGYADEPGECPDEGVATGCTVPVQPLGLGLLVAMGAMMRRRDQA